MVYRKLASLFHRLSNTSALPAEENRQARRPENAHEPPLHEEPDANILNRTVVLIAAGGDASRLIPHSIRGELTSQAAECARAPSLVRDHCLLTMPQLAINDMTFLGWILEVVHQMQKSASRKLPVAIITGPNTHEAVTSYLQNYPAPGELYARVIRQNSRPVFSEAGRPVLWDNGNPLEAPDGTAGCIAALKDSEWFKSLIASGYEYVFVWYGNDIGAGIEFDKLVRNLHGTPRPLVWVSDERGQRALQALRQLPIGEYNLGLIEALEDAPCACVLRAADIDALLSLVEEHAVIKDAPVLLPNGNFLRVIKREKFLTDMVRKAGLLDYRRNRERYMALRPGEKLGDRLLIEEVRSAPGGPTYYCIDELTGQRVTLNTAEPGHKSRANPHASEMLKMILEQLKAGQTFGTFTTNIGEREAGDFLVGSYEILEVKRGGMAIVYICRDREDDGRMVAIKTYTDEARWSRSTAVRRFWHEANEWTALPQHPNVVTASQVMEVDGRLHIVLEYVAGGSLRSRMRAGQIEVPDALAVGIQTCRALRLIHSHDIVHRDIKPENILLTEEGVAKVTDLGLVALLSEQGLKELVGTRGYMPPEQISSPENITIGADIYSLGVVFHEMLTGNLPGGAGSSPLLLNPRIPASLSNLVMSCLGNKADRRPTTEALEQALAAEYFHVTGKEYPAEPPWAEEDTSLESYGRVSSLGALGRLGEALELCEKITDVHPSSRVAKYNKAMLLYDVGRYEECAALCFKIMNMPESADDEVSAERVRMLLDMCSVWQGVPVGDVELWLAYSHLNASVGRSSRTALKLVETALKLKPEHHRAWYHKAVLLYNLGQYEDSLKCFNFALQSPDTQLREIAAQSREWCQAVIDGSASATFKAHNLLRAGRAAIKSEDYAAAEEHFRAAMKLSPHDVEAMSGYGLALIELGRPAEALEYFDSALVQKPSAVYVLTNKARVLSLLNRYDEAMGCYDLAVELEANNYNIWNSRGLCLTYMGRFEDARACFRRSLEIEPKNEKAVEGLAACKKKLSSPEGSVPYWLDRGMAFVDQSRLRDALSCFRTAMEIDPESPAACYNAGYILWMMGQHHAAIKHCERTLAIDPSYVHAWNIRGNALGDLERNEEALESFERAIAVDPKYYEAWNGRGLCLGSLGRLDEAIRSFDRACSLSKTYSRGWFNKALILSELGRHQEAIGCLDKALLINPSHRGAWRTRGDILLKLSRHAEATVSYQRAVAHDPNDFQAWNNLGSALLMSGDVAEAMISYRRALSANPECAEARANLGRIESILRDQHGLVM